MVYQAFQVFLDNAMQREIERADDVDDDSVDVQPMVKVGRTGCRRK